MDTNNNQNNNTPKQTYKPSSSEIQRQSIQHDIDKHDARQAQSHNNQSIIGQHNYSYSSQEPNQKTIWAKLRRKFRPLIIKWKQLQYHLEESSRRRKKIIVFTFLGIGVLTCLWGHFDKPPILIENTSVGTKRIFSNQDTIKLSGEKYDPDNHTMRADFVTNSSSGELSPQDLGAKFILAQAPKHTVRRPTMNLVPTFNNHFTVVVHHLYDGFGGIMLRFHNKSDITLNSVADNGLSESAQLSDKDNNLIQHAAHSGATYSESKKADHILDKLRNNDMSNFIIGEDKAKKDYRGYVNPNISPKDMAVYELHLDIKHDRTDIHGDTNLQNHEKALLKQDQKKIRQINGGADIGHKSQELQDIKSQDQQTRSAVSNYQHEINGLKKNINTDFDRITRLQNDVSVLPKTQSPQSGTLFSNSAH